MPLAITTDTPPTEAEVRADLEAGRLPRVATRYSIEELAQALSRMRPMLWHHRERFAQKGYPDVAKKLVVAERLRSLAAAATADRMGLMSRMRAQTRKQAELKQVGIALRDAVVQLALDAGADPRSFRVSLRGNVDHAIASLATLEARLAEHGDLLRNPVLVAELLEKTRQTRAALHDAEVGQETTKKELFVPANLRRHARQALYALLLHFSRTGGAVFWDDPETRACFSLRALRDGRPARRRVDVDVDAE